MTHALVLIAALMLVFCVGPAFAFEMRPAPTMPAIFSDNMVLQAGKPVPVWGHTRPGLKVTVKVAGQEKSAAADAAGKWRVMLDAIKPGGPMEMTVQAEGSRTLTIRNILAGEVWLAGGQSNMGTGVGYSLRGQDEVAAAKYPKIRIFQVPMHAKPDGPADDIGAAWGCFKARWIECSPDTIGGFPAVAYFFGQKIHKELDLPVGLIACVWGGTGQEAWLSREALASDPEFKPLLERRDEWLAKEFPKVKAQYQEQLAKYDPDFVKITPDDGWEAVKLDESQWQEATLPGPVKGNGVTWFRRTVTLPAELAGKELRLALGSVPDEDVTYVNGRQVGKMNGWDAPREYPIPGELTKEGRLVIAMKATGFGGGTGPSGKPEQMLLKPLPKSKLDQPVPLPLAGTWKYRVAIARPVLPLAFDYARPPGAVYNGIIAPLAGYGLRGVLWYQGEGAGFQYARSFPAMIRDWRKQFGQGDFPFLYVQLPNLSSGGNPAVEESWVNVRETHLRTLAIPNTGMAVTIDVGDPDDVHYRNKRPVGERLALWALAKVYDKKIGYSGPLYDSMSVEGDKIRIKFRHAEGGLADRAAPAGDCTGSPLKQFLIAGKDRKFVPASAKIDKDGMTVLVWSDKVPAPAAVRYAWLCNPEGANLYNKSGLPASPFRTDDWPWKAGK